MSLRGRLRVSLSQSHECYGENIKKTRVTKSKIVTHVFMQQTEIRFLYQTNESR